MTPLVSNTFLLKSFLSCISCGFRYFQILCGPILVTTSIGQITKIVYLVSIGNTLSENYKEKLRKICVWNIAAVYLL